MMPKIKYIWTPQSQRDVFNEIVQIYMIRAHLRTQAALADRIGINMHTVNKAYTVLKQEGILTIDRRRGAVVRIDADKLYAKEELRSDLKYVLAKAFCKNISKEEVHEMVDEIYEEYK